jgi:hypothetical protein
MAINPTRDPAAAGTEVTVPFRTVLFSMVVLWATYFALITFRSLVMDFGLQFELGWRRLVVTGAGLLLTLVLWLLLRLFDNRPLWIKISAAILLAMPVALAIGQVNHFVFKDMELAQEQLYAKKYNINLRRDESGNLLVDVPVRHLLGTAVRPRPKTKCSNPKRCCWPLPKAAPISGASCSTWRWGGTSCCWPGPRPITRCWPACRRAVPSGANSSSVPPPRPPNCGACAIR